MKRLVFSVVGLVILATLVSGCLGPGVAQVSFSAAPWQNGEVTTYDVLAKDGNATGTATWRWQQDGQSWVQAYALNLGGRIDRGEVLVGQDLQPVSSWRELNRMRFDTTYGADKITIKSTGSDGQATSKALPRPAGPIDNDVSLQIHRALPLVAWYAARYTDVIPTSGAVAPVTISVTGAETLTVPAGVFPAWHVALDYGSGSHDAWYAQAEPHLMIQYRNRASGAVFQLHSWQAAAGAPVQGASGQTQPAPAATPGPTTAGAAAATPLNVPFLLAALLVQYPLMILFPLALGWWIHRRYRVSWGIFGVGALTFVASQVGHLPFNWAIGLIGGGRGVALWPLPLMALVAGLSAGVFEECARWIVLRFFLRRARGWRDALQFGAGHGGAEAIIFGSLALLALISMLVMRSIDLQTLGLSGAAADQTRAAVEAYWKSAWYMPLVGGLERVCAITFHIAMAVLVMRAITRRRIGYLLAAIGAHAALDMWAVWSGSALNNVWTEAGVVVAAMVALGIILRMREAGGPETRTGGEPPAVGAPARDTPASGRIEPVTQPLSGVDLVRMAERSRFE